jgi:PadR family transcriptional regulator AphA
VLLRGEPGQTRIQRRAEPAHHWRWLLLAPRNAIVSVRRSQWYNWRVPALLTESCYAVLILLALRGPSTAYQVKRGLERLAGEFWAVPRAQVYRDCVRLVEAGLLTAQQEESGRRRRVLELTPAGRDAVTAWVREPTDASMEIRDVALLKVAAIELSTPEDVRALAERQVIAYEKRLAGLADIETRMRTRPGSELRLRNLAVGYGVYTAQLNFWKSLAADPFPVILRRDGERSTRATP